MSFISSIRDTAVVFRYGSLTLLALDTLIRSTRTTICITKRVNTNGWIRLGAIDIDIGSAILQWDALNSFGEGVQGTRQGSSRR